MTESAHTVVARSRELHLPANRSFLSLVPEGSWVLDVENETLQLSKESRAILSIEEDERAVTVTDIAVKILPSDRESFHQAMKRAGEGETITCEFRVSVGGESCRWVLLQGSSCGDGTDHSLFAGSLRDISKEKQIVGERIARSEAILSLWRSGFATSEDLSGIIRRILRASAKDIVGAETAALWLFSRDQQTARCFLHYRASTEEFSSDAELFLPHYPKYYEAVLSRRLVIANDAQNDQQTRELADSYLKPRGITSMLDVPIQGAESLIGILCFEHTGPLRSWSGDDCYYASAAGDFLSFVWQTRRLALAEERISVALQAAGMGLWELDCVDGILITESYGESVTKQEVGFEKMNPTHLLQRVAHEERELVANTLKPFIGGDNSYFELEFSIAEPPGRRVYLRGRVVQRDNDGRPLRVIGLYTTPDMVHPSKQLCLNCVSTSEGEPTLK